MQSLFIKEVRGNKRGIRLFCKNGVIIFFPSARAGFFFSLVFYLSPPPPVRRRIFRQIVGKGGFFIFSRFLSLPRRPSADGFFVKSSARACFLFSLVFYPSSPPPDLQMRYCSLSPFRQPKPSDKHL